MMATGVMDGSAAPYDADLARRAPDANAARMPGLKSADARASTDPEEWTGAIAGATIWLMFILYAAAQGFG